MLNSQNNNNKKIGQEIKVPHFLSPKEGEFEWNKSVQSTMMSAFFYGYLVLQIPGGWLAGRFGGKRVLGIGVLVTALATVLMPMAARWDYRSVYVLRAVMGLAQVSRASGQ